MKLDPGISGCKAQRPYVSTLVGRTETPGHPIASHGKQSGPGVLRYSHSILEVVSWPIDVGPEPGNSRADGWLSNG